MTSYKHVPNATVEYDDSRGRRIRVGDAVGKYASYNDVATLVLEVNGKIKTYIAVTDYGLADGVLQPETVYEVTKP